VPSAQALGEATFFVFFVFRVDNKSYIYIYIDIHTSQINTNISRTTFIYHKWPNLSGVLNILLQVKEQPHERDLHNTMDTILIFDTMTGLRTEAKKSTTINISQSTFMNRKRTNMFGIHNILQTIKKYTLLSSQVNVNCPACLIILFTCYIQIKLTFIKLLE
jgi:hypothetical protein